MLEVRKMQMFRIKRKEQEILRKKAIELNKKRIENGKEPLKDSELLHELIEKMANKITITNKGELTFDI